MNPAWRSPQTTALAPACEPGALPGGPTRTRFFDGMFLTQADLENEQRYWRLKRRLTNRMLGAGVAWGLRVGFDQSRRTFTLSPGYAIDCCGNDLVVECPVEVSARELLERADLGAVVASLPPSMPPPTKTPVPSAGGAVLTNALGRIGVPGRGATACVVLQYVECAEDGRPVHADACSGATSVCEPSRVRETARLMLVPECTRPKSPPEIFWDELTQLRDSLPPEIEAALFPPAATEPPSVPAEGTVPLSLTVKIPGSPGASWTAQPTLGSVVETASLTSQQTPADGTRTGVVTFELVPSSGWGITGGAVRDGSRVVEQASPPMALSMYWSLDLGLPEGVRSQDLPFRFEVDNLAVEQMFASRLSGRASFQVEGTMVVAAADGGALTVSIKEVRITTSSAEVVEGELGGFRFPCFSSAVPWGWAADAKSGSRIARVLLLSAVYAALSDLSAGRGSDQWRQIAVALYRAAWGLLGVDPTAVDEATQRTLVGLLTHLYQRWCDGLAYPGPRCTESHHGVYLGCATLGANNAIVAFDMWHCRRYVLTGPLLSYWAGQFGVAPIDVIVGRFAEAICCLAGQPAIVLPPRNQVPPVDIIRRLMVADSAAVARGAKRAGLPLRWVGGGELAARFMGLFVGDHGAAADSEVLAIKLEDGGAIGVVVPRAGGAAVIGGAATAAAATPALRDDVVASLRRGPARVAPAARPALADLTLAIAGAAPVSAVASGAAQARLARRLDGAGVTMAGLLASGPEAAVARLGLGDAEAGKLRDAADGLADRAELALDGVALALSQAAGARFNAQQLTDKTFLDKAGAEVSKVFDGKVSAKDVAAAARRVAG